MLGNLYIKRRILQYLKLHISNSEKQSKYQKDHSICYLSYNMTRGKKTEAKIEQMFKLIIKLQVSTFSIYVRSFNHFKHLYLTKQRYRKPYKTRKVNHGFLNIFVHFCSSSRVLVLTINVAILTLYEKAKTKTKTSWTSISFSKVSQKEWMTSDVSSN